jgi:branched-chain amino acid transport system substrate-binding protein
LKQLRAVGVTVPYVAGDGNTDPQFIAVAGADAEGVYMTSPPMTTTIPAAAALIQQYTARFKTSPGAYAAYCWDAVNLIADTMKRANSTTNEPAIITALRASNYQGITGTLSFDQNGDLNHAGYIMMVIKNGQFTNYTGS